MYIAQYIRAGWFVAVHNGAGKEKNEAEEGIS